MFWERNFSSLLKTANQEEKDYLNSMFLFAQGEKSTEEFVQEIKAKKGMVKYILSDKKIPNSEYEQKNFERMILDDFSSYESRYDLYRIVHSFFIRRKIKGNYFNIYFSLAKVICENTPDQIYLSLDQVLKDMPENLTNNEQLNWCKNRCKELCSQFKYEKTPPEWVQEPQWPKYKNHYMVFSFQEEDGDKVTYHFYDLETGYQKDIVQYY